VCTDAHGNRDFCVDGENCLMVEPDRDSVCAALARVIADHDLRERLGRAGEQTAKEYAWERRIDALVEFLEGVARPTRVDLDGGAVPEAQRTAG
jgi:glycosyltransferase involved in cell wall biosynthesis